MELKLKVRLTKGEGVVKAFVDIVFDDAFVVHGIKVIESDNGFFVAMPSKKYKDSEGVEKYADIFHPINAEAREILVERIMNAYQEAI